MNFKEHQWKSRVLFNFMITAQSDAKKLEDYSQKLQLLKNSIKLFQTAYQDDALNEGDIVIAARKLWNPKSRVEGFTYNKINTSVRVIIGDGLSKAMGVYSREVTSYCNKWRITKAASDAVRQHNKNCRHLLWDDDEPLATN